MDHVQVSIQSFGDKFGNLSDTLKDIVSSHRVRYATEDEMRKKILSEISGAKEFLQHIRSNTQSVSKSFQNLVWETQEMRCGGKDAASGTVSTHGRFSHCSFECDHGEPEYFDLGTPEQDGT